MFDPPPFRPKMRATPESEELVRQLLKADVALMLNDIPKNEQAWKKRAYPVPKPTRRGLRMRAALLRTIHRWKGEVPAPHPATIMVPALHNLMPAESVALGWLNEIEVLKSLKQRMAAAARITGWDAFTFHTAHNADAFFNTTIDAVRDTWVNEGILTSAAVRESRRRFPKPCHYHCIEARLVENLIFQSSFINWIECQAADLPLRIHIVGTSLLSALTAAGSITFDEAVECAMKFGRRSDQTLNEGGDSGWPQVRRIRLLIEGKNALSLPVAVQDLPKPEAPAHPFVYSPAFGAEPILITTAQEAWNALQTMDLNSWASAPASTADRSIRGWLVSPLHPMARRSRWSLSDYLLSTPNSVKLFLDNIAAFGRVPSPAETPSAETIQNRLRLSRMKVTGP
jgi:hypothetical protein